MGVIRFVGVLCGVVFGEKVLMVVNVVSEAIALIIVGGRGNRFPRGHSLIN